MQVNKGLVYTDKQYIELLKNHIRLLLKENEYKEKVKIKQEERIDKAIEYIENIYNNKDYIDDLYMYDLLKILKGKEND